MGPGGKSSPPVGVGGVGRSHHLPNLHFCLRKLSNKFPRWSDCFCQQERKKKEWLWKSARTNAHPGSVGQSKHTNLLCLQDLFFFLFVFFQLPSPGCGRRLPPVQLFCHTTVINHRRCSKLNIINCKLLKLSNGNCKPAQKWIVVVEQSEFDVNSPNNRVKESLLSHTLRFFLTFGGRGLLNRNNVKENKDV